MPKRILLADDSITIQKVVELTFSDGDYEVTAVNNGARAIQKLGEMRPDIILSDIIMPEKNGYEVCEYVKSHPEHRNIPVVLLTGTFEPFDPDRAEKAGCDAVVTKPFESQSLIHKVEELIANAQANAQAAATTVAAPIPTAPPPPPAPEPVEEAPSPWMDDAPIEAEAKPSPFTTSTGSFPAATPEAYTHDTDIFGSVPPAAPAQPIEFDNQDAAPFGAPPPADEFSGETRAFPRMSFDDFQQAGAEPAAPEATPPPPATPEPAASEPSPWDEPDFGGETRAFGKMTFDDLQAMAPQAIPNLDPEPQPEAVETADAPFGAPAEVEQFSGETRAFPRMSFDELQSMTPPPPPPPPSEPEPVEPPVASAWDEPAAAAPFGDEAPLGGGDTNAFPRMSFDDLEQQMATPAPEPESLPQPESGSEPSPWDEQPAFGGETRAFPKMSYEELAASAPEPEPAPWEQPSDVAPAETSPADEVGEPASEPALEEAPVAAAPEPAPEPVVEEEPGLPGQIAAASAIAEVDEPVVPAASLAPDSAAIPIRGSDLSDDQVDRIARRVVELMSDHVIRNIAWEVIPDLAEMVVKERIRQLESEA